MRTLFFLSIVFTFSLQSNQLHGQGVDNPVKAVKIGDNLYKLSINSTAAIALIGSEGVLLADVGLARTGPALKETLRTMGGSEIKLIIYTHWHVDHTGGARSFNENAKIIAHENVRQCLMKSQICQGRTYEASLEYTWPNILITNKTLIYKNNEEIELIPFLPGHTNGDVAVYFRKAQVLFTSDLFVPDQFPSIDYEHGGYATQLLKNIQIIVDMLPNNVKIISAHGRDYTIEELKKYQEWLGKSYSIIINEISKGSILEDMIKGDILKDIPKLGDAKLRKEQWIQDVYKSIKYKENVK